MPRPRRSVVVLCIAIVALAAILPGVSALDYAVFEPSWVLLPDLRWVAIQHATTVPPEQPLPLFSLLPPRAPPLLAHA